MACAVDAVPQGWRVWRGNVPPRLTDMAIEIRDHIRSYGYGSIPAIVPWKASDGSDILVGTWVCHHSWTYKNGVLVTGICIPGVTLVYQPASGGVVSQPPDSIATPDPNAAMYPAESIDWPLIGVTAVATVVVVAGFLYVVKPEIFSRRKKPKRLSR